MPAAKLQPVTVDREYGPFPGAPEVHGVTWDGALIWFAAGHALCAVDPASGEPRRSLPLHCNAGTAFDGQHLFQIAGASIHKVDPATGQIVATIPAPPDGANSGLTWAEGFLWVGQYHQRRILQLDPATGTVVRTLPSDRFVTGVSWVDGELWHATWEGDSSELRRIDAQTGEVLVRLGLPADVRVSGLEAAGDVFLCGGGPSGKIRTVKRRSSAAP